MRSPLVVEMWMCSLCRRLADDTPCFGIATVEKPPPGFFMAASRGAGADVRVDLSKMVAAVFRR